jgi:hypothetical protein
MSFSRYLKRLAGELDTFDFLETAMRKAAVPLALAALTGCAASTKYVSVNSEPPGAEAEMLIRGKWVDLGRTPVRRHPYISSGSGNVTVKVGMKNHYEIVQKFDPERAPEEVVLNFSLSPAPAYSWKIITEPEGAMIEYYGIIMRWDPEMQFPVLTGKKDWIYMGLSPLEWMANDDGDGIVTVRISKPGFQEKVLNLPLGQEEYRIELEEK